MTCDVHETVYDVFRGSVETYGGRPLFNTLPSTAEIYGIGAGEFTFAEASGQVDAWAERLAAAGYGAGMRVAVLLENRPAFFVIWLALNRLGASVVPINPDLRSGELEYMFANAEPALIIAIEKRQADLQAAADAAGVGLCVVAPSADLPAPRANAVVAAVTPSGFEREAALLYTSGTTGKPKGCVLANSYALEIARWYTNLGGIVSLTTKGERMITPLPIFHMNAMVCSFMAMVAVGGCLTVLDRFHPCSWWRDVRDSGATCLHYLGVMPSMLMGAEPLPTDKDHNVRFGFGAGVDPKLHAAFEERFGFPLMEAWAMTETGAGAVISNHTEDRLIGRSALGRVPDWLDVRVVDDRGEPVAVGQPGELLVRRRGEAPRLGFFTEYYRDPQATAEAWADGWFHTGDIVREGDDGYMFFVDRKKNVIRRSGENIAAVEVESILMRHPDIQAAAVAPVADAIRGDEVFACLTVDEASAAKAVEIVEWALTQMAYYKVPGYVAFVDKLPLTSTQKIQRAELKALVATLVDDAATIRTVHLKKRSGA